MAGLHDLQDMSDILGAPISRRSRIVMRDPQQDLTPSDSQFEIDPRVANDSHFAFDLQMVGVAPGSGDPRTQAQRIIDEARATAEQMLLQAREACVAELESSKLRGYEQGYGDGMAAADRETAGTVAAADAIAANVAREREDLLRRSEQDVVKLAIQVAEKLVCGALAAEPERVLDICRGAMRKAFQRDTLTIVASPFDLEALRAAGPAMAAELGGVHHLDFVEERRLPPGSIIVRTPVGEIDATVASKLEVITDGFIELVAERRAEREAA